MADIKVCRTCGVEKEVGLFCPYNKNGEIKYENECKECRREYKRKYREENQDRISEYNDSWRKENREHIIAYREENKDKRKEYNDKYYVDNLDKISSYREQYRRENRNQVNEISANYRRANPDRYAEYSTIRRARKLNATPAWLTDVQQSHIRKIYSHARDCYLITGEPYHVDHIVPLQGRDVCGLHVPWNLQVLPADVNLRKNNKMQD